MQTIITVDFDSTLSVKEVAEFVKELIQKYGIDVWILTSRYDEIHKHNYAINPTNNDMYAYLDVNFNYIMSFSDMPFSDMPFPKHKIIFTNMKDKADYLKDTNILCHLDDDQQELFLIGKLTKVIPIDVTRNDWEKKVLKLLSDI